MWTKFCVSITLQCTQNLVHIQCKARKKYGYFFFRLMTKEFSPLETKHHFIRFQTPKITISKLILIILRLENVFKKKEKFPNSTFVLLEISFKKLGEHFLLNDSISVSTFPDPRTKLISSGARSTDNSSKLIGKTSESQLLGDFFTSPPPPLPFSGNLFCSLQTVRSLAREGNQRAARTNTRSQQVWNRCEK